MRVHASASDLFDRAAEISTFQGVSKAGLGPKLLMLFDNGRVEEFLTQHVTLAAADLHDAPVSCAIAETMAHFHICMVSSQASAWDTVGSDTEHTGSHIWDKRGNSQWVPQQQAWTLRYSFLPWSSWCWQNAKCGMLQPAVAMCVHVAAVQHMFQVPRHI